MRLLSLFCSAVLLVTVPACDGPDGNPTAAFDTYVHYRAAWSPDGTQLAFTATINGQLGIYAVDTSGANLRLLHAGDAIGVTWSPDGLWIAYSQTLRIYRSPVDRDAPELIVATVSSIRPSWSPDGTRIAYVRNGIRTVSLFTGLDQQVVGTGTYPGWRPDSRFIFASERVADAASGAWRYRLFVGDADSLRRADVTSFVTLDDCAYFVLSPDGTEIVYSRRAGSQLTQIRKLRVATGSDIGLTFDGGDYPAMTRDGEWIAYTRTAEGDGGLWIMRRDGSEKRRVTAP